MSRFEEFPATSADMRECDDVADQAAVPAGSEDAPVPLHLTVSEASVALRAATSGMRRRRVERPTTSIGTPAVILPEQIAAPHASAVHLTQSVGRVLRMRSSPEPLHPIDAIDYGVQEVVDADDRIVTFDDEERR